MTLDVVQSLCKCNRFKFWERLSRASGTELDPTGGASRALPASPWLVVAGWLPAPQDLYPALGLSVGINMH